MNGMNRAVEDQKAKDARKRAYAAKVQADEAAVREALRVLARLLKDAHVQRGCRDTAIIRRYESQKNAQSNAGLRGTSWLLGRRYWGDDYTEGHTDSYLREDGTLVQRTYAGPPVDLLYKVPELIVKMLYDYNLVWPEDAVDLTEHFPRLIQQ